MDLSKETLMHNDQYFQFLDEENDDNGDDTFNKQISSAKRSLPTANSAVSLVTICNQFSLHLLQEVNCVFQKKKFLKN